MSQSYHFLDFILKPKEKSLYHKKERVELGLKGFKLLVLLVNNHGKILPKDELINEAWENQIVTDGTLSKQIERIRHVLGKKYPDVNFIETVRGIGYKFIADVKTHKNRKKGLAKWQKAIASVSIIPIVILLYFYPFRNEEPRSGKEEILPLNIAVIPSAQAQDYINIGGLSYFSNLLDKNPRILTLSPQTSWFDHENQKRLAIELEDQKQLDYVLLVNLSSNENKKTAKVQLKNSNNYNKQETISATSHKDLFSKLNNWVREQLQISNNSIDYNKNLSNDEFALESYLRGLKESNQRNYKKAIDYFQTAINQDTHFDLARIRKAESQILTSDYTSAKSIIEILKLKNVDSKELKLLIQTLYANILVYTEQAQLAKPVIDSALKISEELKDTKSSEKLLYLKSTIYLQGNNMSDAIESTIKQHKLLKNNVKDPTRINRVENNLGYLFYYSKQYNQAKIYLEKSIEGFEKNNSVAGMFSSYNLLASILYQQANFFQEQTIIRKADVLLDQVENKRLVLGFLETKSYLQIELGLHDQARKTLSEIENLATVLGTKEPELLAKGGKFELDIRKRNKESLKSRYNDYYQLAEEIKPTLPMISIQIMFKLIQADLVLDNIERTQRNLNKLMLLPKDQQDHWETELTILKSQLMLKTRGIVNAKRYLNEILKQSINDQHNLLALNVAYILIDFAIEQEQNFEEAEKLVNLISHIKPFPYPYLKYKAKLSAQKENYFEAAKLMQEMKNTSNQWWNTEDQIILDSYTGYVNNDL